MTGNYPFWLRSTIDPSFSLSALNTASTGYGLRVALLWWFIGITWLAATSSTCIARSVKRYLRPLTVTP